MKFLFPLSMSVLTISFGMVKASDPYGCDNEKEVAVDCLKEELGDSQGLICINCLDAVTDSFYLLPSSTFEFDSCEEGSDFYCSAYHTACDDVCGTCKDEIEAHFLCIAENSFPECGDMTCDGSSAPSSDPSRFFFYVAGALTALWLS